VFFCLSFSLRFPPLLCSFFLRFSLLFMLFLSAFFSLPLGQGRGFYIAYTRLYLGNKYYINSRVYSRVSRNRKPECLILILWLTMISFLVRGWCGSFLSFHRASCSLWNEATKTWSSAPKIRRDEKGKQQEKKGKKLDGGCSCKVLFSLFGVVKIMSFMMIQPPSPAFNVLLQFNPLI